MSAQDPAQDLPEVNLAIVYQVEGQLSEIALQELRAEVESIFRIPGLRIHWKVLDPSGPQDSYDRLVVVRFRQKQLTLSASSEANSSAALGFTHLSDEEVLPFIEVDCQRLRVMVNRHFRQDNFPRQEAMLGRAIGRVLSHELYHVLGKTRQHGGGVTQAMLSVRDLTTGRLELPPQELERVTLRLFPRHTLATANLQ